MKFLRVLFIVVAAVVVLTAIAVVVAFNSGFQTWAARKAIAGQPNLKAEVGRVSVGLNRVDLAGIKVVQPGMILTLPAATIDLPVLDAARKKVAIRSLKAHGWTLDLTAPTKVSGLNPERRRALAGYLGVVASAQAAPAAAQQAFTGIFGLLNLPVELSLENADLAGEVIFPTAAGQPPGRAQVQLTGGGLGAGREGRFELIAKGSLTGAVTSMDARSVLVMRMDTPKSIDRLSAVTDVNAIGPQFPQGALLRADLQAERGAQGAENYRIALDSGGRPLLGLQAQLPSGGSELQGRLNVSVRDSDLAPFALGRALPAFEGKADANFGASTAFTDFRADGNLDLTASRLEAVQAELKALGTVRVNSTFGIEQHADSLRVKTLQLKAVGAQPFATIDSRQAFEYNLKTGALAVADPQQDLLAIALEGVPLVWAQPFLQNVTLTGGDVRGVFVARAVNGGFSLRSQAPLTISTFSLASGGKPMLKDVNVLVTLTGENSPRGWQAEVADLTVRTGQTSLLTLSAKAGQATGSPGAAGQPIKATGNFATDLPAILAQPVARAYAFLATGALTGEFTVSSGVKQEVAAKLEARNWVAVTKEVLPQFFLDLRADIDSQGKFQAEAPLRVEQAGRKSDLAFNVSGQTAPRSVQVDARLASKLIYVDDVKILLAPFAGSPEPQPKPAAPKGPGTPDAAPPWAGVTGKLALALEQVVYSPELTVRDITGTVAIGEAALTLDALKAVLSTGGQVKVNGGVAFKGAEAKPYALKADVAVSDLDSAAVLKAVTPGNPNPMVEGRFDVTSQVTAQGANLGALAEEARGDLRISSKGGFFRPVSSKYVQAFSEARAQLMKRTEQVGTLGALAGALGAKLPGALGGATSKAQTLADRMGDIEAILKLVTELKFDQLTLDVGSDSSLDTVLRDLTITTPEIRFVGSGGLKYQPNIPLWKQALSIKLNGAARGKAADVMKKNNLLGEKIDSLGYAPMSMDLNIDGTAEKPDTSKLIVDLLNRVLQVKLQPGDLEKLRQGDVNVLLSVLGQLR